VHLMRIPAIIAVLISLWAVSVSAAGDPDLGRSRISTVADTADRDIYRHDDVLEEISFGREVAARVIGRYGLYRNAEVEKYVNLVGRAVALHSSRSDLEFRFGILNTDEVNGYAAPGGYVLITRGALERMHDESELAGVLAHEIGHITERHAVKELNIRASEGSAVSGFARLIGGGTESARAAFSHAVDRALDMLFKDGYKREDEVQADRDAVIFTAAAGYDPYGLVRYFKRLETEKGRKQKTEVLDRTHPPFEERIATMSWILQTEGLEGGDFNKDSARFGSEMKVFVKNSR
jgi:predicted Zn-dependent protease